MPVQKSQVTAHTNKTSDVVVARSAETSMRGSRVVAGNPLLYRNPCPYLTKIGS